VKINRDAIRETMFKWARDIVWIVGVTAVVILFWVNQRSESKQYDRKFEEQRSESKQYDAQFQEQKGFKITATEQLKQLRAMFREELIPLRDDLKDLKIDLRSVQDTQLEHLRDHGRVR